MTPSPLLIALALGVFALLVVAVRHYPAAGVVGWLVVVCFVPVWFAVPVGGPSFPPASLAAIAVVVGIALSKRVHGGVGVCDVIAGFFFIAALAPIVAGGATMGTIFVALSQWLLAFLLGRLAGAAFSAQWMAAAIAVVFTIVALLALIEFFFSWHPFVDLGPANDLHASWGPIQIRGSLERSEWAFGHSIALGGSIALAVPFALVSQFRPALRVAMCAIMAAGVVVTFSRGSLVCLAFGVVLTLLFVRTEEVRAVRRMAWALLVIGAAVAVPIVMTVLADAGTEAEQSAQYRGRLTEIIGAIGVLGISPSAQWSPSGVLRFGTFRSIDNQLLLTGLSYGAVCLVVGLLLLIVGTITVLRGRAGAAVVAVTAQIPLLTTVALITQYSMFFWFIAGLAVASAAPLKKATSVAAAEPEPTWAYARKIAERT